ncbi:MAG: regulatory protein RecX [Lentisphaeria bacterium]|nr:regulatory protein RecX [Lentisphaeria bacterium]MBR1951161.1 regulatory protein RecX [Lentisphaeria bacterium]
MPQPQKKSLLELAAGMLSRRNQTKMELRKKLYRKSDADPQEIEDTLTRLEEMGYLSDRKFAEDFVRVMRDRSYGDRRIYEKMTYKGIAPVLAREVLANTENRQRTPLDDALALLNHRARRLDSIPDPAKLNHRIMCMLAGRGFSADVINKAIAEWQNRPKDQTAAAPGFDDADFDDPDSEEQDD